MKNRQIAALFLCGIMSLSLLAGCASNTADADNSQNDNAQTTEDGIKALYLSEQGIFSAGGITVTSDGTFDPENQWEETGAGQTAHVDHANVLYQIPAEENEILGLGGADGLPQGLKAPVNPVGEIPLTLAAEVHHLSVIPDGGGQLFLTRIALKGEDVEDKH